MGMHTEIHFNAELKKNTPALVLDTLRWMVDGDLTKRPVELPDHPLFKTSRWAILFRCDSYYFDADTHSTLRLDDCGSYFLCVRSNLKNYDGEIQKFVNWITPYLDKLPGDFLGFSRYEESETPDLIYMPETTGISEQK